ncbi:E3 ubiquitin-protein ligase TRIM39-like isoform X2 [Ambystoma mexicanum]|uniref:E3 ubiquitin-protein ligase TRIM39-like isoform X2 n=1 Tax=Ambystoma mexicanum TaxID=8296 RepID=UPI0037E78A34
MDYYKDPWILGCGHSFCQDCLVQCRVKDATYEGWIKCPRCWAPDFEDGRARYRPNRQLGNIVNLLKVRLPVLKQGNLCEKHMGRLQLFCEDDMQLICVVCDRSQEHRSHRVIPVEEAATKYKECQKSSLSENNLAVVKLAADVKLAAVKVERKVSTEEIFKQERTKIFQKFKRWQQFLEKEKQELLCKLQMQEQEMLYKIEQTVTELDEQSSSPKNLIEEIKGKWEDFFELLKVVQCCLSGYDHNLRDNEIKSLQKLNVVCAGMSKNQIDLGTLHAYVQKKKKQLKEMSQAEVELFPDELDDKFPDVLETSMEELDAQTPQKLGWWVGVAEPVTAERAAVRDRTASARCRNSGSVMQRGTKRGSAVRDRCTSTRCGKTRRIPSEGQDTGGKHSAAGGITTQGARTPGKLGWSGRVAEPVSGERAAVRDRSASTQCRNGGSAMQRGTERSSSVRDRRTGTRCGKTQRIPSEVQDSGEPSMDLNKTRIIEHREEPDADYRD